ncbi:hypothetical protein [Clostridium sp.]
MLIFLFSVISIGFGVYYTLMNQKLSTQKTQLKIVSMQNREFKSKITSARNAEGPIIIKYKTPFFKLGTTKENCSLYLSPVETSPVLSNIVKNISVEIQDSAEILDTVWYEISFKSQTNINNKGWIKKDSIITQDDTINNQDDTIT